MKPNEVVETVKHGALRLEIRRYSGNKFGFDYHTPGYPRRKVRLSSLADAREQALELIGAARAGQVDRLSITPEEYQEFLLWKAQRKPSAPVPELVRELLATVRAKGVTPKTEQELRLTLNRFAKQFPCSINLVDRKAVERWMDSRTVGNRRWNNIRASLLQLFRYARKCGHLPAELHPVETMERRVVKVTVETYSPDEMRRLLGAVQKLNPEWLPLLVLGGFAGLRPQEIAPDHRSDHKPSLRWENVLWSKQKIDVPARVAKDGRRRFAPLLDVAARWLEPWRDSAGPVCPRANLLGRLRAEWCDTANVAWKPDGLRHSYASYRIATVQNIGQVSLEMGNSPQMIHTHYLDLKMETEAAEWFGLYPCYPSPERPKPLIRA